MRYRLFIILALMLGLLAAPPVALAHASMVKSEPAAGEVLALPPEQIRLVFDAPIDVRLSAALLYDSFGVPIGTHGPAQSVSARPKELLLPLPPLAAGTYALAWRALSLEDGHTSRGLLVFAIGTSAPGPVSLQGASATSAWLELAMGVARLLEQLGLLLLLGGLSLGLALRPALGALATGDAALAIRRWSSLLLLSHPLLLLGALAGLLASGAALGQEDLASFGGRHGSGDLLGSSWGLLWLARMGLIVLLLPLLLGARGPRWRAVLAALLAALLLAAGSGASSARSPSGWEAGASIQKYLHQLIAAGWLGLVLTLLAMRPGRDLSHEGARLLLRRAAKPGALALALLLLPASGLLALFNASPSLTGLAGAYGAILLAKLLALLAALALGALALRSSRQGRPRWRLAAQACCLLLALGLTALLEISPAPTSSALQAPPVRTPVPYRETRQTGDLRVTLSIDAIAVGVRVFTVVVQDASGQRISPDQLLLRIRAVSMSMEVETIQMLEQADGRFTAQAGAISMRGIWEALVIVRRGDAPDLSAKFPIVVE